MHHGDVSPEIAQGLLALKKRIDAAKIPSSKLDQTINVAVWNIREFGKVRRTEAAIHFIAEILGQFDLIALVELRNDLTDLGRVLPILGPSWDVVYSDWLDDSGGNNERVALASSRRRITLACAVFSACTTPFKMSFMSPGRMMSFTPTPKTSRPNSFTCLCT